MYLYCYFSPVLLLPGLLLLLLPGHLLVLLPVISPNHIQGHSCVIPPEDKDVGFLFLISSYFLVQLLLLNIFPPVCSSLFLCNAPHQPLALVLLPSLGESFIRREMTIIPTFAVWRLKDFPTISSILFPYMICKIIGLQKRSDLFQITLM